MKTQKTLAELQELQQAEEFYNYITYNDESSEPDDLFSEQEIINPENHQHKIDGWCPIEEQEYNAAVIATTVTTQYHNWRSELVFKTFSKYTSEEEADKHAKEIIEELKAEYPAIISIPFDIEKNDYTYFVYIIWGNAEIMSPY